MDTANQNRHKESEDDNLLESSYDLSTIESTLEQLDVDIPRPQQKNLRRLTYHNRLIPISKLPTELLLKIFRELVPCPYSGKPDPSPYSDESDSSWLDFIHVCQVWRQVAFNDPSLWTFPDFKIYFERPYLAEWLLTCAKGLPLDIVLVNLWCHLKHPWLIDFYYSKREKIRSLKLVDRYKWLCTFGFYRLLPRVERLILHSYDTDLPGPRSLPEFEAPLLKELEAHRFGLPIDVQPLPFLTTLILDNTCDNNRIASKYRVLVNRILDLLSGSPLLQVVKLQNTLLPSNSQYPLKNVSMPNLKQFTLLEDTLVLTPVNLLHSLVLPEVEELSLNINMDGVEDFNPSDSKFILLRLGHFLSQCPRIFWHALGAGTNYISLSNAATKLFGWRGPKHKEDEPNSVALLSLGLRVEPEDLPAYLGQVREILPLAEVETLQLSFLPPHIDGKMLGTLPTISHLVIDLPDPIETSIDHILALQSRGFLRSVSVLTLGLEMSEDTESLKEHISRCIENGMPLKRVLLLVNECKYDEEELLILKDLDVKVTLLRSD